MVVFKHHSAELEEFSQALLRCAGLQKRKGHENFIGKKPNFGLEEEEKLVCVTSGLSYLGLAIVNRLLARGYLVRVIVHNQEDVEKIREMEIRGEIAGGAEGRMDVALANLTEFQSLLDVFDGCVGVFHTSAFVDPVGLSGYSKAMAEIEVKATENVMEACVRTNTIRKCVLTSSLLACIWRGSSTGCISQVIDHECWSDELFCIEKKLWYALGKLRSEKLAWRIATENGLKLTTLCPGLITGPEFSYRNPTATTAYFKGAQDMYGNRLLATVDVTKLAVAHVCVYEAMNGTAFGRYVCFDRVIKTDENARRLAEESGIPERAIMENATPNVSPGFELSNRKLNRLLTRTRHHCYEDY